MGPPNVISDLEFYPTIVITSINCTDSSCKPTNNYGFSGPTSYISTYLQVPGFTRPRCARYGAPHVASPRKKKAYVRLTQDYDALDVANRIGASGGSEWLPWMAMSWIY